MNKRMVGGFKRAAALMMSIFIVLSQLALPAAALAQDLNALPDLNLYYPAGEGTQSVRVEPALYAQQPVYWATVPADALASGVTLEILPTGTEGESYNSTNGYELKAQDANAVDGMMMATFIEVYLNGGLAGSYPLYLSTQPLPPEEPVYFDPVPVEIICYDQNNAIIDSYSDSVGMEGKTFHAPELDGYALVSDSSVTVTMDENGYLSQDVVGFYYAKQLEPAMVRVEAYDQNNNLIYSGEEWIEPGAGREISAPAINGYTLTSESTVWVEMDGDGNLNTSTAVFYYAKQLQAAAVRVEAYDQNNNLIYSGEEWIEPGAGREISAPAIDGYTLTSESTVWVEMDGDGNLNTSTAVFYYAKQLQAAAVRVEAYDQNNNLIYSGEEWIEPGAGREISAPAIDGYTLTSESTVWVEMDGDGNLNTSTAVFYYAKQLQAAAVRVEAYDQNNNLIYSGEEWIEPGAGREISAPAIDGYTLTSESTVWVEMDGDGNLNTSTAVFYYAKQLQAAAVRVEAYDQNNNLIYSGEEWIEPGAGREISAPAIDGYTLTSESTVWVEMDGDGNLNTSTAVFYYASIPEPEEPEQPVEPEEPEEPKYASITVKIVDSANRDNAFFSETKDYAEGTYTFTPDAAYLPENYVLDSAEAVTVNVYADGTADLHEIVFTATYYAPEDPEPEQPVEPEQPEEPKYASITVKIVDSADWNNVFFTETKEYSEGAYSFTPDAAYLPENYVLDSAEAVTVNVYADGTADLHEIVFTATYYAPEDPEPEQPVEPEQPEEPKYASITVKIVDSADWNNVFFTETKEYSEGAYSFTPDAAYLPENYVLDSVDAVTVNVYADGTADLHEIVFTATYYAPEQPEPEQPVEPEQPEEPEDNLPDGVTLIENLNCEGETTKGSLRFRSTPTTSTDGNIVFKGISKGTIVQVTSAVENAAGELWYGIIHNDTACYVKGDCLKLIETEPASADVLFLYQTADGITVLDSYQETLTEGTYQTAPYFKEAPEGYAYVGVNAESFTISENGAEPGTIVFTYEEVHVEPVMVDFIFEYKCEDQYIIDPVTQTLGVGSYPASDYVRQFEGYTFIGASQETLVVNEDGTSSVTNVLFDYNRNPVTAEVTIRHQLEDGSDVPGLSTETRTLDENTYDVQQFIQYAEGYSFLRASAETIVVDQNGANPAEVTLTYQKDLVQAQVTVHVQDTEGNAIAGINSQTITLGEGTHAAATLQPADPAGYAYSHASAEQITVTASGADPETITFYYQKLPVEASVTFYFVDEQGNPVNGLESYTITLGENTYDTAGYAAAAPSGYQYNGPSASQIVVDENGASPAEVFFYYAKLPESISIPVYHQDADGKPLMESTGLTFSAADFGKTVRALDVLSITAPEGYVYAGVSSETITIDQRGGVTPEAIHVTYVVRPAAEADVTFYYECEGENIAEPVTATLSEGEWDTNEYAIRVEGYQLVSASAETVTVDQNGTATPAEVTFRYEKKVTTANLYVHYCNSFGEALTNYEIRPLGKGTHTITPNPAYVPEGYVLSANTQSFEVTVYDDLSLSVTSVSFKFYEKDLTAAVTVNYYDTESATIFATETVNLAPGTHTLQPNEALVSSKGNYEKSDYLTNTNVIVDEKGVANPTTIVFYYQPVAYQGYQGYLLVTEQTAIRKEAAAAGEVLSLLEKNTVLWSGFQYKSGATEWFDAQTQTGDSYRGWVDGAHVRKISAEEAQILIEEANQPDEPEQNPGYYITIMNNVPLRKYMNTASQAKYLNINTVVQVTGQEYDEDGAYLWHASTYYDYENKVKYSGYIRDGQLRKLTQEEVDEYLSANGPVDPDDPVGSDPYDPNGPSSYGYVSKDGVNFRSEPGGTRIKLLNKYAMALIIGTREVNGVTWYNVNYSGQVGWIHGDYFHQMTLSEFTAFMGSEAYYQGISNNTNTSSGNTSGSAPSSGNTGSATQGNVSSVEDWNVGAWQNTGATTQSSYQPFNPYATPVATTNPKGDYITTTADVKFHQMANDTSTSVTLPKGAELTIAGTVTANGKTWYQVSYDGRNGYVDAAAVLDKLTTAPTATPTSTFAIGTMIPITYDDQSTETQSGTVPWGLIAGAIVLVGGAGGVYAYALNQNKKRKAAAARAAANRRRAAQAAAAGTASPYARRAVAAAPNGQPQRPAQPNAQSQYARPASAQQPQSSPYTRPQQPAASTQPVSPAQPQQTANPYARPAQPAPIVNPYAASASHQETRPAQTANPYARPITPVSQQAQTSASSESASAAPRRTRMQRYHDASNGGTSTDA